MDAAEQQVGFFNQELRPIKLQSGELMMATEVDQICLIGDRGRKRSVFRDQALMASGIAADKPCWDQTQAQ